MATLIRKNFHYEVVSHSLSSFLFPPFYIMNFSSLSGGLLLREFFVLCLVKAQVRSALKRSTMEKFCFSDKNFFSLLARSFSLSISLLFLYLLEIDDNLNFVVGWFFFRQFRRFSFGGLDCGGKGKKKCEKFYFYKKRKFYFSSSMVVNVPQCVN